MVPESQAYMDLLAFERKLDATIMRKRLDIQEALKRPMKQKRKLRIFISNTFYPGIACTFRVHLRVKFVFILARFKIIQLSFLLQSRVQFINMFY